MLTTDKENGWDQFEVAGATDRVAYISLTPNKIIRFSRGVIEKFNLGNKKYVSPFFNVQDENEILLGFWFREEEDYKADKTHKSLKLSWLNNNSAFISAAKIFSKINLDPETLRMHKTKKNFIPFEHTISTEAGDANLLVIRISRSQLGDMKNIKDDKNRGEESDVSEDGK